MRGIVLAGGSATRLRPATTAVGKQLLPVYDTPLVQFPVATVMAAGIREILVISTPTDGPALRRLLGDGSELGVRIDHAVQHRPAGIAEALLIGADHIGAGPVALVLGDNLFDGPDLPRLLHAGRSTVASGRAGCVLYGRRVPDPERFGVGEVDGDGRLVSIEEKPARPRSDLAIAGLYLYGSDVVDVARSVRPSARGELEITDVNRAYVAAGRARLLELGSGTTWLDAGTPDSLLDAARYVQRRTRCGGARPGCVEEVALEQGWIDPEQCLALGRRFAGTAYGAHVTAAARASSGLAA